MREPKDKQIGEVVYRVRPLGAKKGCAVLMRLKSLVGKTLQSASGDDKMAAIGAALESFSEADLQFLCDTMAPVTQFSLGDGKWPVLSDFFEEHFSANYANLFKWLWFTLEVNYHDFFDEVRARYAALSEAEAAPTKAVSLTSLKEKSGSSGESSPT